MGYADEDGDMFLLYFYGLQIVAGVQSMGIWELEMMKNWTEAQIERHQGLILIGTQKHALSVAPNDKHYYCALEPWPLQLQTAALTSKECNVL